MEREMQRTEVVFGVDTGGTFTDIVGMRGDGRILLRKVDNQAADPTISIASGISQLIRDVGIAPEEVSRLVHCTTLLGNSVIERKGPICGLITTAGFRDVLELGRQHNPVLYDIFWKKTAPLVPRRRVVEVQERMAADGTVVKPVDRDSLEVAMDVLEKQWVRSIAICLINSCTNAAHEVEVADRVRARFPEVAISLSSEISPEWGEYERTSTTVTDAFLKPTFAAYIGALRSELSKRGIAPELLVMQSAGSIAPAKSAIGMPVHSLDSGPAAAVVAAANIGAALGFRDVLTLEIGGTTAKSTLIENGEPRRGKESEIGTPIGSDGRALRGGGYVLRMPVIDAAEVGAGGGSIARVDAGGSLSVGPEGAGAFPGPASYGRGGEMPTVTDANLVLGYLSSEQLLGGTIKLDPALAARAIDTHVAKPLRITRLEAAFAIRSLANAIVGRAVRSVSTERGRDVRRFSLLAAGGGGPSHAAEVARVLGIRTVIIPPYAGLFAALGMLWSPPEQRLSQAVKIRLDREDAGRSLVTIIEALMATGRRSELGMPTVREEVDVHYVGQFHDLTVPIIRRGNEIDLAEIRKAFEVEHERTYGYASSAENCGIRSVRVILSYPGGALSTEALVENEASIAFGEHDTREIYFGPQLGTQRARLLSRRDISDQPMQGPLVIPEYDTTIIVPPDFTVRRGASNVLILNRVGSGS
jgi:N-methylhydantoinase A